MALRKVIYFQGEILKKTVRPSLSAIQTRDYRNPNKPRNSSYTDDFTWAKPLVDYLKDKQQNEKSQADEGPHMLHVVRRIDKLIGRPWWEKEAMKKLGLGDTKKHEPVLVKNIPLNNELLSHVKHLVQIQKMTFPHGLPVDESDFKYCMINSKGEMIVKKKIAAFEPTDELNERTKWSMKDETLEKDYKRTLLDFRVRAEYLKEYHEFKYNQDGKEYRYNHNKNNKQYKN